MKLTCKVEVVNRLHSNLNIKSNGKYIKSTLAVGKEPKGETEYFLLHFSTANKSGTKYRVKFIKQVFVKFINEGKITIRFEDPPHDLCVQCEVVQLKCFLNILKSCITGKAKDVKVSNLSSISVTAIDNAPTKLVIRSRADFTTKGFPRTLETLHIVGIGLCNFRREILSLILLTVLDLSNNEIEKIPYEFARMPNLRELYLANNALGKPDVVDWRWLLGPKITTTLKLLDLCGNKLKLIPNDIWKLRSLVTLKLDNNLIHQLPASLARLRALRYLTLSRNSLESLPCSLFQCSFEDLDLSMNKFDDSISTATNIDYSQWDLCVGSLVHISAKVILKHNMFYTRKTIPWTLVDMLDNAKMCICGRPVLNDIYLYKRINFADKFKGTSLIKNSFTSEINFECYFCSPKCLLKLNR
ncbi:unnamed protein product [Leptidea sinapis]|uniref:PIF1/LRR1 pleckstrin homology domain-containing protein n=1 Tax=Leptidea sinapis TaxID=189913 RepID=A0A5E4QVK9_9NEOP|nr:unnamed protein product [Leptidea sinapis]